MNGETNLGSDRVSFGGSEVAIMQNPPWGNLSGRLPQDEGPLRLSLGSLCGVASVSNGITLFIFKKFSPYRKASFQAIINPDWDFNKMGIGGLDKEFSAIFRRAFASRVFPPEVVQQLGNENN